MQDLKELIEKLPPELQKEEVRDFVEFLLKRRVWITSGGSCKTNCEV